MTPEQLARLERIESIHRDCWGQFLGANYRDSVAWDDGTEGEVVRYAPKDRMPADDVEACEAFVAWLAERLTWQPLAAGWFGAKPGGGA